jgi:hypothetical protein
MSTASISVRIRDLGSAPSLGDPAIASVVMAASGTACAALTNAPTIPASSAGHPVNVDLHPLWSAK